MTMGPENSNQPNGDGCIPYEKIGDFPVISHLRFLGGNFSSVGGVLEPCGDFSGQQKLEKQKKQLHPQ